MTTAPDTDQDSTLYGPDGRPLTRSATQPAVTAPRSSAPSGDWQPITTRGNATVWEKTPPQPAPVPAADPADAAREAFRQAGIDAYQARIDTLEARIKVMTPTKEPRPAPAPAQTTDNSNPAEPAKPRGLVDRFGPKVALAAAVGLTASGEYALAHMVGFPGLIAALLPIAIDVYVIQAMRRHRDVAAALLLMVATNALFHLADAGLFGVVTATVHGHQVHTAKWWLIVAVAAVAPFIVWRVHRITETKTEQTVSLSAPGETITAETETETETTRRETAETEVSPVSVSPRETTVSTPTETETRKSETAPRETPAETRETRSPRRETSETKKTETNRETKPRTARPARETETTTVTAIGDRETETTLLLDLMRSRGGAEKVSLDDAIAETRRPKSTAAKRLAAARDLYAKTA